MKLITAIIKPFRLDQVREALASGGVQGMTVSEVRGMGRQQGQSENYCSLDSDFAFVPKLKIEAVVEDDQAVRLVDLITQSVQNASNGEGKIFVSHIQNAVRIRTGEVDETAI